MSANTAKALSLQTTTANFGAALVFWGFLVRRETAELCLPASPALLAAVRRFLEPFPLPRTAKARLSHIGLGAEVWSPMAGGWSLATMKAEQTKVGARR